MTRFNIREWGEKEFLEAESQWQSLLKNSRADPLFLSWNWLFQWWQNWGHQKGDQLKILAAYDGEELLAIAPLYCCHGEYFKGFLPVTRLEFLGNRYRKSSGLLAEYNQFIVRTDRRGKEAIQTLIHHILHHLRWDEWILPFAPDDSIFSKTLTGQLRLRNMDHSAAYQVNTRGSFKSYLQGLGKNSRLKLFNRRKLLEQLGQPRLEPLSPASLGFFMDTLNAFHEQRFGRTVFDTSIQQFLESLLNSPKANLSAAHSSILMMDDSPISVIFNLQAQRRIYNMQLGYQQDFHRKISLGTLHLGYAIEAAFEDPEVDCFDFLLGEGKNSDYKRHLATDRLTASSWQVIRSPLLKLLYRVNDEGKRLIRRVGGN